jgi:hypothetical protein
MVPDQMNDDVIGLAPGSHPRAGNTVTSGLGLDGSIGRRIRTRTARPRASVLIRTQP